MNRRSFVKNLLGSMALVAAVKVGLGNITTEDVLPHRVISFVGKTFTEPVVLDDVNTSYRFDRCKFIVQKGNCGLDVRAAGTLYIAYCEFTGDADSLAINRHPKKLQDVIQGNTYKWWRMPDEGIRYKAVDA